MPSDLDPAAIDAGLRGRFGRPLRVFDEITSTNDVALEWAAEGAPEGAVVVADHQTHGRGRWGRQWHSDHGVGLLFSLVLRSRLAAERSGLLVTALGVGCARGIEAATGLAVAIKWPNDLVVGAGKVGGILVETRAAGTPSAAVVAGVGINVRWDAGEIPRSIGAQATSLAAELEASGADSPARSVLLIEALASLESLIDDLVRGDNDRELLREATARSTVLGSPVNVRFADGSTVSGTAAAIASTGALELDTPDGRITVDSGEVERVRPV